jgi:hypothetical protein
MMKTKRAKKMKRTGTMMKMESLSGTHRAVAVNRKKARAKKIKSRKRKATLTWTK